MRTVTEPFALEAHCAVRGLLHCLWSVLQGGSHIACADEGALRQQCLSGLATDLRCITCDTLAKVQRLGGCLEC